MKELHNLRAEMARAGLTCADVAQAAGVSRNTVSRWRQGRSAPTVAQADAVARLFGVSVQYLFLE